MRSSHIIHVIFHFRTLDTIWTVRYLGVTFYYFRLNGTFVPLILYMLLEPLNYCLFSCFLLHHQGHA